MRNEGLLRGIGDWRFEISDFRQCGERGGIGDLKFQISDSVGAEEGLEI